ncbi:MAG: S46 family peptidase [Bacteroidales bacterium]
MRRLFIAFSLCTLVFSTQVHADEGMWIPLLLQQLNENEMKNSGLRLSAEDIYSVNQSSLKDAILLFGGGCTAEFVSSGGLILTNHHCGFGQIQAHSSLEHDYITNGFWAMNRDEELSNPGLTAELLIRMEEVTVRVLEGVRSEMNEYQRDSVIEKNIKTIIKEATKDTWYEGRIKPFYYGNVYYLFITEVFKDIRLVGAPPSSIGKFGGDTDNWMWPRHTGDFSVFRVYVGKDGKPAEYSKDNVPYEPKKSLSISLKGYKKGDFTFVYGYPGRTQQYITSWGVDQVMNVENPVRIKLREKRLAVIDKYMAANDLTRIQYVAKSASIANGWKKWIGENRGLRRLNTINDKKEQEIDFQTWVISDPQLKEKYQDLLKAFETTYKEMSSLNLASVYYTEAGQGIELVRLAGRFNKLIRMSMAENPDESEIEKEVKAVKESATGFYKNYNLSIDKETSPFLLREYALNTQADYLPGIFEQIKTEYKGDYQNYINTIFNKSILADYKRLMKFLDNYKVSHFKKILKDPVFSLSRSMNDLYSLKIMNRLSDFRDRIDSLQRVYVKAQMEMSPGKRFYPDANLTLRVAYGKVKNYYPQDAVEYGYFTTIDGILEKEDPDIYDYAVTDKLKDLAIKKDFGRYADNDGTLHTCFIATNHTTGGNSGSPVFNADGHLIGLNFDRCWEGTMSDIDYDVDQCRNITLDIRYCLFVIDKVCNAGYLLNEMTIVQ